MDFDFPSEQVQLADALRRAIDRDYGFETRKAIVASESGTSDALWATLTELGLPALAMPESHGGFGGRAIDLVLPMQEIGRGLVVSPFFATVFAAEFVKRARGDAQRSLLDDVAAGSLRMAAALSERHARHDLRDIGVLAKARGAGHAITGEKTVVAFGAQADSLVVSARLENGQPALFVVDATARGIDRRDHRTLDGQRVATIVFDGVDAGAEALLARGDEAAALLDAVADYGVALLNAEALGAMEALHAATVEYAKTRKQFGQPIGRFQVLQHRMVDMFVHLEQARSMTWLAAVKVDAADATERVRAVAASRVRVAQASRFIGQQAVQIHGGMGVTDELPAAHLFKRLTMIAMTLGDADHHLQRFIASGAEAPIATARPSLQRVA